MGVWGEVAKNACWNAGRGIFNLLRAIGWLLTCRHCRLRRNRREDAYEGTAHVQSVWARHKLDLVLQPSGPENFMTTHHSFEDPEYVLAENVTLYYVTKDEAVFVEVDKGVDVSSGHHAAFVRIAQFRKARRIIVLPMHVFHKLAEKVGHPKGKLIIVSNTSRCGSTLLTQVFEETGSAIALSEPDAMNALTMLRGVVRDEELELVIRHSVNILCKPISRDIKAYILKLTAPTMAATPYLDKLYPEAYHLFMYRDGLKVAQSLARAAKGMPLLELLLIFGRRSPKMTQKMVTEMGLPPEQFNSKVESPIHFCSIVWASAMKLYNDFRDQGINIVGVRYEDMVKDSQRAFRAIFEHCGLPHDSQAVDKAFSRDSQRDSPLSMKNLGRFQVDEFTDEVKKQTDGVCDFFKVARIPEPYISPGTITNPPDTVTPETNITAPEQVELHVVDETKTASTNSNSSSTEKVAIMMENSTEDKQVEHIENNNKEQVAEVNSTSDGTCDSSSSSNTSLSGHDEAHEISPYREPANVDQEKEPANEAAVEEVGTVETEGAKDGDTTQSSVL